MKEKTINFLNTKANEIETLLASAHTLREKTNAAKTAYSKSYYKKKLMKVVGKLDKHIKFFSAFQEAYNEKTKIEQELKESEAVLAEDNPE